MFRANGPAIFKRTVPFILSFSLLAACQSDKIIKPPPTDPDELEEYNEANDPLEPLNRDLFALNMWVYHKALRPLGQLWKKYIPKPVRDSIANLEETWREPMVFFSSAGAGKPYRAGNSFMRFTINMSFGIAGFFDIAKFAGYKEEPTDPGMVFGLWNIDPGPYLFLPGIGPSNIRDAIGYAVGQALTPINYVPSGYGLIEFDWGYNVLGTFNMFASASDQLEQLEHQSLDPYAFLRSAWQQNRQGQIEALKKDKRSTPPSWYY